MQLTLNVISPLGLQKKAQPKVISLKGGITAAIEELKKLEQNIDAYRRDHWERIELYIEREQ